MLMTLHILMVLSTKYLLVLDQVKKTSIGDINRFWLSFLGPLILLLPTTFQYFEIEGTDEGYSRNTLFALNLISTFLSYTITIPNDERFVNDQNKIIEIDYLYIYILFQPPVNLKLERIQQNR